MSNRYARSQIVLHWLTLLMVILTYAAMLLKDSVPEAWAPMVKNLHFNFGVSVFCPDADSVGGAFFPRGAADHATAGGMAGGRRQDFPLAAVRGLPDVAAVGHVNLAYGGKSWPLLGWPMPQWVTPDPVMRKLVKTVHETLANIGYFIIGAHALAALYHHYLRKDDTLRRMMPGK